MIDISFLVTSVDLKQLWLTFVNPQKLKLGNSFIHFFSCILNFSMKICSLGLANCQCHLLLVSSCMGKMLRQLPIVALSQCQEIFDSSSIWSSKVTFLLVLGLVRCLLIAVSSPEDEFSFIIKKMKKYDPFKTQAP